MPIRQKDLRKKKPRWTLCAATEADQPGMGMTNRVLPAQGEERGASLTLMGLDKAPHRKFQPPGANNLWGLKGPAPFAEKLKKDAKVPEKPR
jgi:hypothetical protein